MANTLRPGMLKLAPIEPLPPPTPGPHPDWCRAFGTHGWRIIPPMVMMPSGAVRVTLYCDRCESMRGDQWIRRTGAVDGHTYKYSELYRTQLDDERGHVRKKMIDEAKPRPLSAEAIRAERARTRKGTDNAADGTALRLVHNRKARVRHKPR